MALNTTKEMLTWTESRLSSVGLDLSTGVTSHLMVTTTTEGRCYYDYRWGVEAQRVLWLKVTQPTGDQVPV